jgi:hypothetical protein
MPSARIRTHSRACLSLSCGPPADALRVAAAARRRGLGLRLAQPVAAGEGVGAGGEDPPAGGVALALVGLPSARPGRRPPRGRVQLDEPVHRSGEHGAVVGHEHEPARPGAQQRLEAPEAVRVQVVRRLVEQQDVQAGGLHAGQAGPRGLPAGQRGERPVEQLGLQPEPRGRRVQARAGVRAPDRQPALQGVGVRLDRGQVAGRQTGRLGVERPGRRPDPEAFEQHGARRPAQVAEVGELGQQPDGARAATWPPSGASSPASTRSSVDLPDPFGPMMPTRSWAPTRRLTSCRTVWDPWRRTTRRASMWGDGMRSSSRRTGDEGPAAMSRRRSGGGGDRVVAAGGATRA